jgi:hypothetical protein
MHDKHEKVNPPHAESVRPMWHEKFMMPRAVSMLHDKSKVPRVKSNVTCKVQ